MASWAEQMQGERNRTYRKLGDHPEYKIVLSLTPLAVVEVMAM